MADNHNDENQKDGLSRRRFIKNTGMVAGGVVGGSLLGGVLTNQFQTQPETQTKSGKTNTNLQEARMFFSRKEDFNILEAATVAASSILKSSFRLKNIRASCRFVFVFPLLVCVSGCVWNWLVSTPPSSDPPTTPPATIPVFLINLRRLNPSF